MWPHSKLMHIIWELPPFLYVVARERGTPMHMFELFKMVRRA